MNRARPSRVPSRARVRLSSAENCQKVYDNKTYKNQLNKMFDSFTAANHLPKKYSPKGKYKDINLTFDAGLSADVQYRVKTAGHSSSDAKRKSLKETILQSLLPKNKRAESFADSSHHHNHQNNQFGSASKKRPKSPASIYDPNYLRIITDSDASGKQKKKISHIFKGLLNQSLTKTKIKKALPETKPFIAVPERRAMTKPDNLSSYTNTIQYTTYDDQDFKSFTPDLPKRNPRKEKFQTLQIKKFLNESTNSIDDHYDYGQESEKDEIKSISTLPSDMEDTLMIKREIAGSRASLLSLSTKIPDTLRKEPKKPMTLTKKPDFNLTVSLPKEVSKGNSLNNTNKAKAKQTVELKENPKKQNKDLPKNSYYNPEPKIRAKSMAKQRQPKEESLLERIMIKREHHQNYPRSREERRTANGADLNIIKEALDDLNIDKSIEFVTLETTIDSSTKLKKHHIPVTLAVNNLMRKSSLTLKARPKSIPKNNKNLNVTSFI